MNHLKKKHPSPPTKTTADQCERPPTRKPNRAAHVAIEYLTPYSYQALIDDELHRQATITHINPAAYSPETIQAMIDEANLREGY